MTSVLNILVNQVGIWPFVWMSTGSLLIIGDSKKEVAPLEQWTVGTMFLIFGFAELIIKF